MDPPISRAGKNRESIDCPGAERQTMSATAAQERAIAADGNVLVTAGAGAGKTSRLVERCVRRLVDPQYGASLHEILMVTFTESAAAEMRARVRKRLEQTIQDNQTANSTPP